MNENKIFKEYKSKMNVSPIMQKGDSTNAVVYSFDLDTSKFTYELKMNGQPLSLANASSVDFTLFFGAVDSKNNARASLNGVIEDRVNSKVSFIMPKQYLGYDGRVLGEVNIQFANGQTLTAGHFSFVMKQSYINEGVEIAQQVYVERFEDLEGLLKETSEAIKNNDIAKKQDLKELELNKADKFTVDKQISDLLSDISNTQVGMLGMFTNLEELTSKFPNGEKGYAMVSFGDNSVGIATWNSNSKLWEINGSVNLTETDVNKVYYNVSNIVTGGNFRDYGADWSYFQSTGEVKNNTNFIKGSSSNNFGIYSKQSLPFTKGDLLFVKMRIRVVSTIATNFSVYLSNGTNKTYLDNKVSAKDKPLNLTWYDVYGILDTSFFNSNNAQLFITGNFSSATTDSIEIYGNIVVINLTKDFGKGNELSAKATFDIIQKIDKQYFEGEYIKFLSMRDFTTLSNKDTQDKMKEVEISVGDVDKKSDEINDKISFNATNSLIGGDFKGYGADWYKVGGNGTVANRTFTVTGDGSLNRVGISSINENKIKLVGNSKYYFKSRLRVRTGDCNSLTVYLTDGKTFVYLDGIYAKIPSPKHDIWYDVDGYFDIPDSMNDTQVNLYIVSVYTNAATANTKTFEAYGNVVLINTTEIFGKGNEPTAEEIKGYLAGYPSQYFDGTIKDFITMKDYISNATKTIHETINLGDSSVTLSYDSKGNIQQVKTFDSDGKDVSTSNLAFDTTGNLKSVSSVENSIKTDTTLSYSNGNINKIETKRSDA